MKLRLLVKQIEKGNQKRDEIVNSLNSSGVECRPIISGNFVRNPVIKYFDYTVHNELIKSDVINDCGFFVENHYFDISNT